MQLKVSDYMTMSKLDLEQRGLCCYPALTGFSSDTGGFARRKS